MNESFIAHIREVDKQRQSVQVHLLETAVIASMFAVKLDLSEAGELLGLMHDFGKYSTAFQEYIRAVTGQDPDADNDYVLPNGKKIDHSTAGAQWVYRRLKKFGLQNGIGELVGQILGLCIASHHGEGLIDCLNMNGEAVWQKRFDKEDELTHLSECEQRADKAVKIRAEELAGENLVKSLLKLLAAIFKNPDSNDKIKEFYLGCLTRFLFSCLIDADRINSADFEREEQKDLRRLNQSPDWQQAIDKLETHLANFEIRYPIDEIRREISSTCLKRANDPQGIYTLTVPTGGGKTLASLRYALHHAHKHNLDRIIYIIPYTSIIDQNASAVREILGEDWVLEHHSNLEPEQQNWQDKLLSENWDKPIVFTTMVQFLDAWFGGGTRGVRHIHPMTKSVLIFDEIQTLPVKCVHLFCNVLNWLTQFGKSSAVLCTATQPLLDNLPKSEFGELKLAENSEIMGQNKTLNQLFDDLSRVEIHYKPKAGGWSADEAGAFLLEQFQTASSCLFIVNTKKWAQELYQYCQRQDVPPEALFHLSTNQCSVHRKAIFDEIKGRLKNKQPVICISTQLIEAGVDISMSCVIRALGGLDSIAQAAGRCNRHGEKVGKGQVYVLNLQEPNLARVLPDIDQGQQNAERVLREFAEQDILQPAAMRQYFEYYFYNRSNDMSYTVKGSTSGSLLDWLSDNRLNVYAAKNDKRRPKLPLLMQSFKSAGRAFQAIDAPTRAVIVPYSKGKDLIAELCGVWNPKEMYRILSKVQRYSVNVFPNVWEKLEKEQAVQEVQAGLGIYYLKERYYSDEYGLSVDEVGAMTFYEL
ncbi:CRISPR-associated helicase/endonuclease Cas3 [Actinobacillus succinogenes]|uniref:CRISPR-associated helicase Cas3 n=1 Tax=Actinobacillus succinogenes (strain ATCC 55618 / DSM 22257 / CCUG 43843 / 130Z) TaxID=339671 RepID=A6VNU7_ACTSZ|nr:CRISPR-associated helicase/endonuclease Cas3 [Actinobacillus succinogenes]ABR74644.1 CRISPR-associated helicase Cas3 [Actinobacillus succinogenes 130Z]PHI40932.1 CRISPR-associated helicase/endonuclease Cas3 [Actinobacillus succinogenes]